MYAKSGDGKRSIEPSVLQLVMIDDEVWMTCPIDGPTCYRVNADVLGSAMGSDAVAWHIEHHHRPWRHGWGSRQLQ
jgi:hypothetical protein